MKIKKAKFYKHRKKNFTCLMLENHLFDKDDEFLAKLLKVIKLFYKVDMIMLCNFFADSNDEFANKLNKMFGDKIDTIFTKKRLFSRTEYSKRQVHINETNLNDVLANAIKYNASPQIEVKNRKGVVLFEVVLNDNEGTFINFSTIEFNLDEIKTKISQILND